MRGLDDVLLELSKVCLQLGENEVTAAAEVHPSLRNYKWVTRPGRCMHSFVLQTRTWGGMKRMTMLTPCRNDTKRQIVI